MLPYDLINRLVAIERDVEAWSKCLHPDEPAFKSVVDLQNAICDLVLDEPYGDEAYVATIATWNCLQHLKEKK